MKQSDVAYLMKTTDIKKLSPEEFREFLRDITQLQKAINKRKRKQCQK